MEGGLKRILRDVRAMGPQGRYASPEMLSIGQIPLACSRGFETW